MRRATWMVLLPIAVLAAACGRNSSPVVDDALKADLALASQMQPANAPISPTEVGLAAQPQRAPQALRSVSRQSAAPSRRASSSGRARASSGGTGGYYPAPAPPTTIEKNTGRDAAIGAAAGAVLGAVSSRDKIKGGIIGAAAGGILGAVIGNNVDVHKKVGW